jgi:outer membrane protein assembly factor BamB
MSRASSKVRPGGVGRWVRALRRFLVLMALVGTALVIQTTPGASAIGGWPQFRYGNEHTGYNPHETTIGVSNAPSLISKWVFTAGDFVTSSPAVANGVVYFGSHDHKVYALDAATGALLWSYTTGDSVGPSSPAVANGVVYVGSGDQNLYALDASTGALRWSYTTGGGASSPAVANGVVYVGSNDDKLYALDASTGALLWSHTTGGWVSSSPAVVNGVVYFGSNDNKVYALDAATGISLWSYTTGSNIYSSPAVANGIVYVGGGYDDKLCALDASTGALLWSYATGGFVGTSPAVANGVVYFSAYPPDNKLYALDAATGAFLWSYTDGPLVAWVDSNPAIANGVAYVGSAGDSTNLYALDASTGALLRRYATGTVGGIVSSPAVANGMVYVGSNDHKLYAFGVSGLDAFLGFQHPLPSTKPLAKNAPIRVRFTLGNYQGTTTVSTATTQVTVSTSPDGTSPLSVASCIYKTASHVYECRLRVVGAKTDGTAYYVTVFEKIGASFIQVPNSASPSNTNPTVVYFK